MHIKQIHYINQLDYADVIYPTTLDETGVLHPPYPTIAQAGCGLCCTCMMVEKLTGEILTVKQSIELSIKSGANFFGTNMERLGEAVCEKYGLRMKCSNKKEDLKRCFDADGCAVINAGGTHGVFSEGGHFLLAFHAEGEIIWILDPSFTKEKYLISHRREKVKLQGNCILVDLDVLDEECENRTPSYFLFWNA